MKCRRLLFGGTVWGLLGCGAHANEDHSGGGGAMCMNVALTKIPRCAQMCFMKGAPDIGCSGTDFACQCAQQAGMMAAIEGCVKDGCPSAKYQAVIDGSQAVCECVQDCKSSAPSAASASGLVSGGGASSASATAAGSFMSSAPTPAATSPCLTVTVSVTAAASTSASVSAAGTNKTSTPAKASTSSTAPPAIVTAAATGSQAPIGLLAGVAFAVALL